MLKTEREKAICDKYSALDKTLHVHCNECPLNAKNYGKDMPPMTCKAIMHYDRHLREWIPDDDEDGE